MVYKLKHPNPSQGGFIAGVDFSGGLGTTNSLADANRLKELCGCEITAIVDGQERPVQIVGERHRVKIPGVIQEVETGPVILRAVISESKTEGGPAGPPSAISPAQEAQAVPAGNEPETKSPKPKAPQGRRRK